MPQANDVLQARLNALFPIGAADAPDLCKRELADGAPLGAVARTDSHSSHGGGSIAAGGAELT